MSAIRLLRTLMVSYGKQVPFRNRYYRLFHTPITRHINQEAERCLREAQLFSSMATLTQIRNRDLSVSTDEKKAIIAEADKSMGKVFNLLGSGDVKMDPILWHTDFIHAYSWPKGTYYRNYVQVNLADSADVKVPRELSRCHHFLKLALAYRFSGEKKYAKAIVEQIDNWIDENPLMYSINWGCTMDVGIRAINWIWALSLLWDYETVDRIQIKIKRSLYQHGWFIYRNLEGSVFEYNNNHYFSDIAGLLHVGLLFREDKHGKEWLNFAVKEFCRELRLQILPCGMSYEGSTNYNRLMLELIMPCVVLLRRNGLVVPSDIIARLRSMFDFINNLTMPDGEMPIIGDQDNGRCLPWGVEGINDYTYLMGIGAAFFREKCWPKAEYNIYAAISSEIDRETFDRLGNAPQSQSSTLYRDAGLCLIRKDDDYLLMNVDNQGFYMDDRPGSGHSHSDWLSFVLAIGGQQFFIDPGTYVYSSDPKNRNLFRSTRMHNTIEIDGKSQADIPEKELWFLPRVGRTIVTKWKNTAKEVMIEANHNGYQRLSSPVEHQRSVRYDKEVRIYEINDKLSGAGEHEIVACFHLSTDVKVKMENDNLRLSKNGVSIRMDFLSDSDIRVTETPCEVSVGYGEKTESKVVSVIATMRDNFSLKTTIKRDL